MTSPHLVLLLGLLAASHGLPTPVPQGNTDIILSLLKLADSSCPIAQAKAKDLLLQWMQRVYGYKPIHQNQINSNPAQNQLQMNKPIQYALLVPPIVANRGPNHIFTNIQQNKPNTQFQNQASPNLVQYQNQVSPNPVQYQNQVSSYPTQYQNQVSSNPAMNQVGSNQAQYQNQMGSNPAQNQVGSIQAQYQNQMGSILAQYQNQVSSHQIQHQNQVSPIPAQYQNQESSNAAQYQNQVSQNTAQKEVGSNPAQCQNRVSSNPAQFQNQESSNPAQFQNQVSPNPAQFQNQMSPNPAQNQVSPTPAQYQNPELLVQQLLTNQKPINNSNQLYLSNQQSAGVLTNNQQNNAPTTSTYLSNNQQVTTEANKQLYHQSIVQQQLNITQEPISMNANQFSSYLLALNEEAPTNQQPTSVINEVNDPMYAIWKEILRVGIPVQIMLPAQETITEQKSNPKIVPSDPTGQPPIKVLVAAQQPTLQQISDTPIPQPLAVAIMNKRDTVDPSMLLYNLPKPTELSSFNQGYGINSQLKVVAPQPTGQQQIYTQKPSQQLYLVVNQQPIQRYVLKYGPLNTV